MSEKTDNEKLLERLDRLEAAIGKHTDLVVEASHQIKQSTELVRLQLSPVENGAISSNKNAVILIVEAIDRAANKIVTAIKEKSV